MAVFRVLSLPTFFKLFKNVKKKTIDNYKMKIHPLNFFPGFGLTMLLVQLV